MRFSHLLEGGIALAAAHGATATGSGSGSGSGSFTPASTIKTDALAVAALANLAAYSVTNPNPSSCNMLNAAKRREWSTLSSSQRIAYTNAIKCLMSKPSHLSPTLVPGAKTRYDDFLAVHINQTLSIHGTANFLSWHRLFTWAFEQALRNECAYDGYQPYWNWGKTAFDPAGSPVFDGSATSMSGNGAFVPHNCTNGLPTGLNCIPPGNGGGCVTSGPFVDYTVNMGPIAPTLAAPGVVPASSLFAYNPRCLRRDITSWVSSNWTKDIDSFELITQYNDILSFQNRMQGDFAAGYYGVHTAGHFTMAGDPGGDLFASPGDPAFWLHHGQIDRTWWMWQNYLSPKTRTSALGGTITINNTPPSRNGTLDDILDLGVLMPSGPITIAKAMSTIGMTGGPFCYIYI